MDATETTRFLAERDARDAATVARVNAKAAPAPQPQCGECGSFLPADECFAPATCPSCGITLPPKPKPAKSQRPWRRDEAFLKAVAESTARYTRAAIDTRTKALIDAYHKAAKAAFDQAIGDLVNRVDQLERAVAELRKGQ